MKRSYMFNLDDFVRIGGRYTYLETLREEKDRFVCLYSLSFQGETSRADVDVFKKSGARMVKYRDDANYALFEKAGNCRLKEYEGDNLPMQTRSFLLMARALFLALSLIVIPAIALILFSTAKRGTLTPWVFAGVVGLSLLTACILLYIKPHIWALMNAENNDLAQIKGGGSR